MYSFTLALDSLMLWNTLNPCQNPLPGCFCRCCRLLFRESLRTLNSRNTPLYLLSLRIDDGLTEILFCSRIEVISLTALIWSALACSNNSWSLKRLDYLRILSKKGRCRCNRFIFYLVYPFGGCMNQHPELLSPCPLSTTQLSFHYVFCSLDIVVWSLWPWLLPGRGVCQVMWCRMCLCSLVEKKV